MTAADAGMDPERLTRYLLGELPGDEEAEIEAALLADDTAWATVRQAEDELIDAYVLGRIDRHRRARVAARVASSPRLQDRVAFSRGLHAIALAQPKRSPSWISRLGEWLGTRGGRLVFAGVGLAVLLLAVIGPRGGDPAPAPVVATLVLEPAVRGPSTPTVAIAGPGVVDVTAVLDPEDVFPRYRVRVVGARGIVWSMDVIGARSAVRLAVPTRALAPGAYELELTGLGRGGEAISLGSRGFRVTGPPR